MIFYSRNMKKIYYSILTLLISLEILFEKHKTGILYNWNHLAKVENIIKLICNNYRNHKIKFRHHQATNVESLYISSTYECFWWAKLSMHLMSSLARFTKKENAIAIEHRRPPASPRRTLVSIYARYKDAANSVFTSCRTETNRKLTCRNMWPYPRHRWRATSRWRSTWGPSCYPGRTSGRERGGTRETWAGVPGA